jgi:hypothetical protein
MVENNEMDEVAEVLDQVIKTAGDNMTQYKMIRHIGSVAGSEERKVVSAVFTSFQK